MREERGLSSMSEKLACPKQNGRYYNPHILDCRRSLKDFLMWRLGFFDERLEFPVPSGFAYPRLENEIQKDLPKVTWINHTTFLIEVCGIRFLTDPIWSERCSPFTFIGPIRRHPAGMKIEELSPIDFVLLSHDHYDHLDEKSVLEIARKFPLAQWLVPEGVKKWFLKKRINRVHEFCWWQKQIWNIGDFTITATSVPAQHFSGRSIFNTNKTLWMGLVVEIESNKTGHFKKRFYFAGDTGYNPHDFKLIGKNFASMDLSLIPIGAYMPRKFMSPVHIDPYDAAKIHKEVNSKFSLSSHWKTFRLSDEPEYQPPYDLFLALQKEKIDPKEFQVLEPGHEINW